MLELGVGRPIFKRLAVIGAASITSSIVRAARATNAVGAIAAVLRSRVPRTCVVAGGETDRLAPTNIAAVAAADLVIICVPIGQHASVATEIGPYLSPGTVVSDVSPAKGWDLKAAERQLPAHVHFVPVHPIIADGKCMARGRSAGNQFAGCTCILTPRELSDTAAVERLSDFWRALGAHVQIMTPEKHDLACAIIDHVPALIAYTLIGTVSDYQTTSPFDSVALSPVNFLHFTRRAAEDPVLSRDTLLANRNAVLKMLSLFIEDIAILSKAIRRERKDELLKFLVRAQEIRQSLEYHRSRGRPAIRDKHCRCKSPDRRILDIDREGDYLGTRSESSTISHSAEVTMKFAARLTERRSEIAGLDNCRSAANEGRLKRYALATHNSAEPGVEGMWRRLQMANLKIEAEQSPSVGAMQVECLVIAPREPVLEELNRHSQTAQTFIPCDGPILIAVARGVEEGGEPDPSSAQVVTCLPGEAVMIEKGVWHSAPYAFVESVKVLSVEHQLPAGVNPDIRDLPAEGWFGEIVWN